MHIGPTKRWGYQNFGAMLCSKEETGLYDGRRFRIESVSIIPEPKPGLTLIRNPAAAKGVAGYIVFVTKTWNTVEGSVTIIAPGVAISAFHVFSDLFGEISSGKLQVLIMTPTADGGRLWRVEQLYRLGMTDVVLLTISLASKLPRRRLIYQSTLTSHVPIIGDLVSVTGCRAAPDNEPEADGVYFPTVDGYFRSSVRFHCSVGAVIESCEESATIRVDTKALGGMSGGAVFNSMGHYIGLLSSSIDHSEHEGTSRVQLIWPFLASRYIDTFFLDSRETCIFDLNCVKIYDRERITVKLDPFTGLRTVELKRYAIELGNQK